MPNFWFYFEKYTNIGQNVEILSNIHKYLQIWLIFANITDKLCHLIVAFGLMIPKHDKLFYFTLRNMPILAEIWKYWQILANITDICKYY